ncbi:MAG: hypothetical protein JKX88_04335 [Marinicaulis sp.]|nr:hypothetical protein [Marinicaulis sp.]
MTAKLAKPTQRRPYFRTGPKIISEPFPGRQSKESLSSNTAEIITENHHKKLAPAQDSHADASF